MKIKNKIKIMIYKTNLLSLLYALFYVFPIKYNRVLFECTLGSAFGDSQRPLFEYLSRNTDYDLIWVYDKRYKKNFPDDLKTVKKYSISYFIAHATSKVWISNFRKPIFINKRKNQTYIQMWHSSIGLKKVEGDAIESLSENQIIVSKHDGAQTDIMTCSNEWRKKVYETKFWFDGKVLLTGSPRCDVFFDDELRKKVKKKLCDEYNLDNSKPILLYAPTFRNGKVDYGSIISFSKLSEKYNCLYRYHYAEKNKTELLKGVDVTRYPDMQELLVGSDVLITDYSSSMFDMMIAQKKCILYTFDEESYLAKERKLYFTFDELPFPKVRDIAELEDEIASTDDSVYISKNKEFMNRVGMLEDGKATFRVAEIVRRIIENEKV